MEQPGQQGQARLRYLSSLCLAGQRQGQRTGLRDCQPLPCSALGRRRQTSHNPAAFASRPLNSLAGLEGSRQEVPVLAHPAHPAFLGTTEGRGSASFCRQCGRARHPRGTGTPGAQAQSHRPTGTPGPRPCQRHPQGHLIT